MAWTGGTERERAAVAAFVKLMRAAESASSRVHAPLAEHQLTVSQFGVLEALYHLGPMCQRMIAAKILKSSGNLTMVIDNLEKRGLVQRVRDQQDRRYYIVHLTDDGRALIAALFPAHVQRIVQVLAMFDDLELAELSALCRRFREDST